MNKLTKEFENLISREYSFKSFFKLFLITLLFINNQISYSQTGLGADTKSNFNNLKIDLDIKRIDSLRMILNSLDFTISSININSIDIDSNIILKTNNQKNDIENELTELETKAKQDLEDVTPNNFRTIIGFTNIKKGTATGTFWSDEMNNNIILSLPYFENISTIFGEMLVDHIGAFRIALSSSITASINDKEDTTTNSKISNAVENFINSGGNLILKTDFPLLYWGNLDDHNQELRNTRSIGIYASNRISLNVPPIGGSVNNTAGIFELALEPQFRFLTNKKLIGFEGRIRFGYVITSQDQKMTLTKETGKTFGYMTASVALNIQDSYLIKFIAPISGGNSKRPIDRASVILSLSAVINKK